MQPDIRYAQSSGAAIAYQVVGDADTDLVFVPDFGSNLVYGWQSPHWRNFYERLAREFRLILFDKRGTGVSDRHGEFATLETRMEDVGAVLDAVGSSEAVILGSNDGCAMAVLYAATHPERTKALALFHPAPPPRAKTTRRGCAGCARAGARRSSWTRCSSSPVRRSTRGGRRSASGLPTGAG